MGKLSAGGTILTGQWRNFDLFWPRASRKHGQITISPFIPKNKPKTFTTNSSFWENLHENRTPEFKLTSCGKQQRKNNRLRIKTTTKNCTQTTRRTSWLSLKHTWDQCLSLAKQCFYLHTFSQTCPLVYDFRQSSVNTQHYREAESWKTKKGFEMHFFSHIPLASCVVFSARINGTYCLSNTISCSVNSQQWRQRSCLFLSLHLFALRRN